MMSPTSETIIELNDGNHIMYEDLLAKIATYLYVETVTNTEYNNWMFEFCEIEQAFALEDGFIDSQIASDIEDALNTYFKHQIAEVIINYETEADCEREVTREFEITVYDDFIPGYTQIDEAIIENREN